MRVKIICSKPHRPCPWFEMHHQSLEEYAARHGYVYVKELDCAASAARAGFVRTQPCACTLVYDMAECTTERVRGTRQMVIEQMEDCDLLVWLGGDTVVTNMTIRFEDLMPPTANIAMPREIGYECDGVMFRNSPEARGFIQDWMSWMTDDSWVWKEYGDFVPAFAHEYNVPPGGFVEWMRPLVRCLEDTVLTAVCDRYPEHAARVHTFGIKGFVVKHVHWEKGDFIMHVPGSTDADKMTYMKIGMDNTVR